MEKIMEDLRNGNIHILKDLSEGDKCTLTCLLNKREDKEEILSCILPKLKETKDWYGIANNIFYLVLQDSQYRDYAYYLLHYEIIDPRNLTFGDVKKLLLTDWGVDYVLRNAETVLRENISLEDFISLLISIVKDASLIV